MTTLQSLVLRCSHAPFLQFSLSKTVAILGRSSRCDFVVDDSSVSRRHAELRLVESELQIVDLGSRNGTFVANMRIQTCRASPGEIVRFGNISFTLAALAPLEVETDAPKSSEAAIRKRSHPWETTLSAAQHRVFKSLLEGLPEKIIAKHLDLSPHTVHNHTRAIFRSFGVHSRAQLIAILSHRIGIEAPGET
jgi:DNA-binding CsgD family transcriptional regulator